MSGPLDGLTHRLLRAGVAPRHVHRYISELKDHLADLRREEDLDEAAALARLGSPDALAEAMLAYPQVLSWTGRAPWATLLVGPALVLILGGLMAVLATVGVCLAHNVDVLRLENSWLPPPELARLTPALVTIDQLVLPLLAGWFIALIALRQRSDLTWPTIGLIAVATLGAAAVALHHTGWILSLRFPAGAGEVARLAMTADYFHAGRWPLGSDGAWSVSLSFYQSGSAASPLIWFGAAWLANLLLALTPYRMLRARLVPLLK